MTSTNTPPTLQFYKNRFFNRLNPLMALALVGLYTITNIYKPYKIDNRGNMKCVIYEAQQLLKGV